MEYFLKYLPEVLQLVGALVVFATALVRLIPGQKDDEKVDLVATGFFRFISYLPTFGVNPRTKKLEEAYKDIKEGK